MKTLLFKTLIRLVLPRLVDRLEEDWLPNLLERVEKSDANPALNSSERNVKAWQELPEEDDDFDDESVRNRLIENALAVVRGEVDAEAIMRSTVTVGEPVPYELESVEFGITPDEVIATRAMVAASIYDVRYSNDYLYLADSLLEEARRTARDDGRRAEFKEDWPPNNPRDIEPSGARA